jgi:hypothetical protein
MTVGKGKRPRNPSEALVEEMKAAETPAPMSLSSISEYLAAMERKGRKRLKTVTKEQRSRVEAKR